MQVTIMGTPLDSVDWISIGSSALAGALCAIPGLNWVASAAIMAGSQALTTALEGGGLTDILFAFGVGMTCRRLKVINL